MVEVYLNLNKNIWSVRENGKVIAHMGKVGLSDVTFRVQPAGRARVLREGKKNVHAYAKGNYDSSMTTLDLGREITYNPYKYESFVYKDDETPVHNSKGIVMISRRVYEVA